jgi:excisionase family DNA binding protein
MATKELSHLLTLDETAQVCRVSQATVRRWLRTGKLPAVTLPTGHYRVRHEDLQRLIHGREVSD